MKSLGQRIADAIFRKKTEAGAEERGRKVAIRIKDQYLPFELRKGNGNLFDHAHCMNLNQRQRRQKRRATGMKY